MLNNYVSMCLDLAFQPFSLLCCRQPSPTSQRLHAAGDTDWPRVAVTCCEETRANYD